MGSCSPRIWTLLWTSIVLGAVVFLPLTSVKKARGQAVQSGPVDMDSLIAAAQDSARAAGIQHVPVYTGTVIGNVTFVQLKNHLNWSTTAGFGSAVSANIRLDEKRYRLQARSEEAKLLGATFTHRFSPAVGTILAFTDSRRFNRVALVGGRLEDFILNDVALTGSAQRQSLRASRFNWDGKVGATTVASEKTFKNDDTQSASLNGGVSFGGRVAGMRVSVGGRAAHKQTWESSTTRSGIDVFELSSFQGDDVEDLGGAEDSVVARVFVEFNNDIRVVADYVDYVGTRSYADQARGSLGSQQVGEENLIWEKETRKSKGINVVLDASPVRGLSLTVRSRHSVVGADYATQITRFSETTTNMISADLNYAARWGTRFTVRMERSEAARDFGPQSIASFDDLSRLFVIQGNQKLTDRTSIALGYDTRLTQSFYIDPSNPRDRDQLDNAITARLTSDIWRNKIKVMIPFSWTSTQFINIDQSQSSNNRVKTRFDFRPRITYNVSDRFEIEQEYWLAFEFTDFDFNETDNSLDRNVNFVNRFRYRITPDISTTMTYRLELHDRGRYLPLVPGGERFFEKDTEDRRDRMALGAEYRFTTHLSAVIDYDYSQRQDFDPITGDVFRVTTDGGIEGGLVGQYNWGQGRQLRLVLKKANRFGAFNAEAQNDFWIMNSELKYTF